MDQRIDAGEGIGRVDGSGVVERVLIHARASRIQLDIAAAVQQTGLRP